MRTPRPRSVAESLTAAYLGSELSEVVGYALVILALLFHSQGLFGRAVERSWPAG